MLLLQQRRDPVHGFVVEQDRPKQRLLGLKIVRGGARRGQLTWLGQGESGLIRHAPKMGRFGVAIVELPKP